jgi:hypothetical protein
MKKLSIAFAAMTILLAGCVNIIPLDAPTETPAPAPSATEPEPTPEPEPTVAVTPEPSVTIPTEQPDVSEPVLLPQVSERIIQYENEYIRVDIHVPEISGMRSAALQGHVNDHAYTEMEELAARSEEDAREDAMSPGQYYINSGFTVYRNDGDFLSICERVEYYSGGANVGKKIIVFNLKNSEPGVWMLLEDLFVPGTDYIDEINEEVDALIAADPHGADYSFSTVYFDSWFYITDTELVIAFPPYEIAPGAYGEIDMAIPLSNFGDMLIPELR